MSIFRGIIIIFSLGLIVLPFPIRFCSRAKTFLNSHKLPYKAIELNQHENGSSIHKELETMTGQRTVPNIFIGGRHLGGSSDLLDQYTSGQLKDKLAKVDLTIE